MSYHGYADFVHAAAMSIPSPRILEIGIDRGQMLIPLVHRFVRDGKRDARVVGVDIRMDDSLLEIIRYMQLPAGLLQLVRSRSFDFLESAAKSEAKFDVIMLDGDHNYYTVSNELQLIEKVCEPHTFVLVDDYSGKWSERDLFYAERESHAGNELATKPVTTEKHGVKPAVDEFLASRPEWRKKAFMPGEPVVLFRETEKGDEK